jgi:hypothetical protein
MNTRNVVSVLVCLFASVVGCTSDASLPGGAALVAESPSPISYTATEAGTAYLRERTNNRVIFSTHLDPGERIEADPAMNRVTVGGKAPAKAPEITRAGRYELFFKAAGQREYHPMYNP